MRVMSNFYWQDAQGNQHQVPVRYGDMSRQVAQILNKNSENVMPTAPFISCYIKDLAFDKTRIQDPSFINTYQIATRATDSNGNYIDQKGANYTVESIMPSPHLATFQADIWTSNTDQKLQIWEQIAVLFNPSLEIQTSTNAIDWTSLSVLTLESQIYSSRTIPQGVDANIDILSMVFKTPIWITPPAKVKQMGVITAIISSVFSVPPGGVAGNYSDPFAADIFSNLSVDSQIIVTPGNFDLLVLNGTATLIKQTNAGDTIDINNPQNIVSWYSILDRYPGTFRAGLSQLRLKKHSGGEVIATISINPLNETQMSLNINTETVPANTIITTSIDSRGTIDAIINPETFVPLTNLAPGTRYLTLEDINPNINNPGYVGPIAWQNSNGSDFFARANDIIQWDGNNWNIIFDSGTTLTPTYITNSYTGIQYAWDGQEWTKSFEGVYVNGSWRLIL